MNVYTVNDIFQEVQDLELNSTESGYVPTSVGSFSLRRAYYFIENGKILLSAEQFRKLTNLMRGNNVGESKRLLVQYLRQVVNIAMRYTDRGLALMDLVREGNHGLVCALENKQLEEGFHFSAYVTWSICQNIERALLTRSIQRNPLQVAHAS